MPERKTYSGKNMSEKMLFIIDCFACYWSPARIHKAIKERFGDAETLKLQTIVGYKYQYESQILQRRKELGKEIQIMNPASRFEMAQEIYDMAIEGVPKIAAGGTVVDIPDPKTAIMAVKLAHDMSTSKEGGEVLDSDVIRSVVKEAYENIRKANPKMTEEEIAGLLLTNMEEDARPYIEELVAPPA